MRSRLFLLLLCFGLFNVSARAQVTPTDPTAPTAFTPSFASSPLSTLNVTSGSFADLKAKIEAITTCGVDVVVPMATYTFTSTITLPAVAGTCVGGGTSGLGVTASGGLIPGTGLGPAVSSGDDYITIRSANLSSITAYGSRVVNADKTNMPTLVIPSSGIGFDCQTNSHHIRIAGLNMTGAAALMGAFARCQSSTIGTDMHHFVMDRNYMTANATNGSIQGVQLGGANMALIGNRITNIHDPSNGNETHGVLIATGSGPYTLTQNEICGQSIGLFIGDSLVGRWSSGTYGTGTPIIPSNGTVTKNYIHKLCIPSGSNNAMKNLQEIKHGQYWKFDSNIYDTTYAKAQQLCIQLVSYRGSQSASSDIQFTNNWVKNCPMGMGVTFRPTEDIQIIGAVSDGTTNCSGGGCVKLTLVGACDCTTGDVVELYSVNGTTEVNETTVPITRLTSTTFTVPIAFTHPYVQAGSCASRSNLDCGTALFFFQARPLERVKISNNLFTDIAASAVSETQRWPFLQISTVPDINPTGVTDNSISATGAWEPNDLNISHNTIVSPTAGAGLRLFLSVLEVGHKVPYTNHNGARWAIRDNVVHISDGSEGSLYGVSSQYGSGGGLAYGTNALNRVTSSSITRDFSHNLGFKSSFADEASKYTGSDAWITSGTGSCASVAVLVDCTAATIAGAALQAGSPGHNASSDAVPVNVGIDATALATALSGVDQ